MTAYRHTLSTNLVYYVIAVSLAVLSPYLTASENYTTLFLFIGATVGLVLFSYPVYCFWLLFYSAFLIGIIISFFPKITALRWGVILLAQLLGFRTLTEFVASGKGRMGFKLDKGLLIVSSFIAIAIISSVINRTPTSSLIVSMKNYFKFVPIIFTLAILPQFRNIQIIKSVITGLLIVATIQIPVVLYQNFILINRAVAVAHDAVCGTFANTLSGGASAVLSLYMLFCTILMISFAKYSVLSWKKAIAVSLFFLIPILFNETKISFIYIPIIFVFFSKSYLRENKLKAISMFAIGFIALLGLGYAYKAIYSDSERKFKSYTNNSWEYNFGKGGYGRYKLNRLTALTFWLEQQKKYGLIPFLIGHGLNAANEGDSGVYTEQGRIAAKHPGYGIGLTMASRLLWETGVIGTACFLIMLLYPFKRISFFLQREHSDDFHSAILFGLQVTIILFCIEFFYNSAFFSAEVSNFLYSLILGLSLMMTQEVQKIS
jgi:hypothetical protein